MSVTHESLKKIDQHWAIKAIGDARRKRAFSVAAFRLVNGAVGKQLKIEFLPHDGDSTLVERVATAFELAAVEGIESVLYPTLEGEGEDLRLQAQAGAHRAYELRCALPISTNDSTRVFQVLHMAALAYCGDRWTDLRRWLKEHPNEIMVPSVEDVPWDQRVLFRLFDCWVRLLRKDQWSDLEGIREVVVELRKDQEQYEPLLLNDEQDLNLRAIAYRLIALYHWAKATESLALYMLQGEPVAIATELDQHFEAGRKAGMESGDVALEVLLRWLHVASRRMVSSSVWWVAQRVNSRVTRFVDRVTKSRSLFELLPPQRVALQEQGLLDQANTAVVVNLPTSGGKTILAQFRILQALNQFDADNGWVAYVAPTRALVSQITRRLRADFEPLKINVEQLSAAVDIDSCEKVLLSEKGPANSFHVLVTTPEKLSLVIRNKVVSRPLALVVLDEAHNIEDQERGLRIELLLATIKRDCPSANFLLLMPDVPNAGDLARWLAPESGRTISLGSSAWLPNKRIIGTFEIKKEKSVRGGWTLGYSTLITSHETIQLEGDHQVGTVKPLAMSYTDAKSLTNLAGAMAKVFSEKGTSIAVARTIPDTWSMARSVAKNLPLIEDTGPEVELVQRFLATEISPEFELIDMLSHGVAVHHAGLSEETRALVEWLVEANKLRVLCATTTIAQGINFPVSSVFLASRAYPFGKEMSKRAFWNLAGRAGRIDQDSVGVVGIAAGNDPSEIKRYVSEAAEDLISRLVTLLRNIEQTKLNDLLPVIEEEEWVDFRSYVAHLWNEKHNLNAVLAETEQLLRNTFGYGVLHASTDAKDRAKADALLQATKRYARRLSEHPENARLADATGFAPEGVRDALLGLAQLEKKLKPKDWEPTSLFAMQGASVLPQLVGIMMQIPQMKKSLESIGGEGMSQRRIAELAQAWVAGKTIEEIARRYFSDSSDTSASLTNSITDACKGIYRSLANYGTWGLSALSQMPTSGLDFEKMPDDVRRAINNLPAMLYHGVNTESAVLMRINSVPRSIAPSLGERFVSETSDIEGVHNTRRAREFLRLLNDKDWQHAAPKNAKMSGADYRTIWLRLSGEII